MEPFRYHVFICDQQKPEGVPGCNARGSAEVIAALRAQVAAAGLNNDVQITTCGSLGLCEWGPNIVVYPDGVWYSGLTPADAQEIVHSHFQNGHIVERLAKRDPSAVKSEICANRDKFYASLHARDAAGALPEQLLQTLRGFQESRVLLTAAELDVFTAVGEGKTAEQIAAQVHTDARATEMLLNALAAMQLLTKSGAVFHNTPVTKRFFTAGSPDNHRTATLHTSNLWTTWSTLTECVRTGTSLACERRPEGGVDWTVSFIAAMHRNATERAPLVVRAVGADRATRMLDVGGGSGAYSLAFAQSNPALHVDLLDLRAVLPMAGANIEKAGLGDRIHTRPGDLTKDALGRDYDLVFMSAICHMLDAEENRDLVRRCHAALLPGGRLVIQDFILEPDKTAPKTAALFSLNMLVGTKAGASYSEPEYADWLQSSGFRDVRRVRLPGPTGLMMAVRG